ncbi:MAG: hypothetical protein WBA39_06995 [Rivularia sp. (in: cyanobacteria)]
MFFHSTIKFPCVLDIFIATYDFTFLTSRESVSLSLTLLKTFASDSILTISGLWLAPTHTRPYENREMGYFVPNNHSLSRLAKSFLELLGLVLVHRV